MRAWGVTFMITAAGCVVLAQIAVVLAFYLIAVVSTAGVIAVARDFADKREQVQYAAAPHRTATIPAQRRAGDLS